MDANVELNGDDLISAFKNHIGELSAKLVITEAVNQKLRQALEAKDVARANSK